MIQAQQERGFDEYERMAYGAIMGEIAHREKRPKVSDLFKRPKDASAEKSALSELKEKTQTANEWLARLVVAERST